MESISTKRMNNNFSSDTIEHMKDHNILCWTWVRHKNVAGLY